MKKPEDSFTKLFVDQLRDLYSAEKQLTKALPKMAKAACSENLKQAFLEHLMETDEQIARLETIFGFLDRKPEGKKCPAMKELIAEGKKVINKDDYGPEVRDAGLIAVAQRAEHYKMSGYGTATYFSKLLGHEEAVLLLEKSGMEEKAADEKLANLARDEINQKALDNSEDLPRRPDRRGIGVRFGGRVPEMYVRNKAERIT